MKTEFLYDIFKKYKFKLFISFLAYFIGNGMVPVYVLPYLLSLFGNNHQLGTLTTNKALLLTSIYSLLFCSEYIMGLTIWQRLKYQTTFKIENNLRNKLFSYSSRHSINYYNNTMSGSVASRITNVSNNIEEIIRGAMALLTGCIIFIVAVIVYLKINIYLSIFFLVWTFSYFSTSYYLTKLSYKTNYNCSAEKNKTSGMITDSLVNIMNVKLFSKIEHETKCIKKQSIEILKKESAAYWVKTLSNFSMFVFMVTLCFGVIGYSFTLVLQKKMLIGTFLFVCQNLILMSGTIRSIYNELTEIITKISDMKEGLDKLLMPTDINDKENAKKLKNVSGKIVFKKMNFDYKKNKKEIR